MPGLTLPTPTPDELDDLIYFCRTGDLASLKALLTTLCATHSTPPSVMLASAIDIDADGLGSQCCLLHYPAANGNVEITDYLLGLLRPSSAAGDNADIADKSAPGLVNHRNVSGNTPLHWAGLNGKLEVVKRLVAAGADPGLRNESGRDAVVESELSGKEGSVECAEWLLSNCEGLEKGLGGGTDVTGGEGGDDGDAEEEGEKGESMVAESSTEGDTASPEPATSGGRHG